MQQTISRLKKARILPKIRTKNKAPKHKQKWHDIDALYFHAVEKRINEQDKEIVENGEDHYVYD